MSVRICDGLPQLRAKQNKAAGAGRGKEAPLGIVEGQVRTAGDECLVVHDAG